MQIGPCQTQLSALKFTTIFILVSGFEFVYFDHQLANKL